MDNVIVINKIKFSYLVSRPKVLYNESFLRGDWAVKRTALLKIAWKKTRLNSHTSVFVLHSCMWLFQRVSANLSFATAGHWMPNSRHWLWVIALENWLPTRREKMLALAATILRKFDNVTSQVFWTKASFRAEFALRSWTWSWTWFRHGTFVSSSSFWTWIYGD